MGEEPRLHGRPTIRASGIVQIGDRFFCSSRPVPSHLVTGPAGLLAIGNDVSIGHGAAIAAFQHVAIGDRTCIGPFLIVMDTNFHGKPGDLSVQHDCRPVRIGSDCRIGSRVTITRGVSIGDGAEILAGSVVSSNIPAGACAAGGRARVIGSAHDRRARWDSAAALVPELIREALALDATPELQTAPSELPRWNITNVKKIAHALETQFRVSVAPEMLMGAATLTEIAAGIERIVDGIEPRPAATGPRGGASARVRPVQRPPYSSSS